MTFHNVLNKVVVFVIFAALRILSPFALFFHFVVFFYHALIKIAAGNDVSTCLENVKNT